MFFISQRLWSLFFQSNRTLRLRLWLTLLRVFLQSWTRTEKADILFGRTPQRLHWWQIRADQGNLVRGRLLRHTRSWRWKEVENKWREVGFAQNMNWLVSPVVNMRWTVAIKLWHQVSVADRFLKKVEQLTKQSHDPSSEMRDTAFCHLPATAKPVEKLETEDGKSFDKTTTTASFWSKRNRKPILLWLCCTWTVLSFFFWGGGFASNL